MPTQKYLCMYRGAPTQSQAAPSPAQMQEMFAGFKAWQEKFKDNILDMGDKLKSTGKVVTAAGVTDGPFAEAKEVVAGFMVLSAGSYEGAVAVVQARMRRRGATSGRRWLRPPPKRKGNS